MKDGEPTRDPNGRALEILKDIIHTHILTGEPVSSRSIAKLRKHGLSAASIRNVMADLEEAGYLAQPHTSAGRVPTRAGYHLYIESLMQARAISARERRYIEGYLGNLSPDAAELMTATTHLLSELSHQIGVVLTPQMGETVLKAIELVPLSGRRILCILVSASGFLDNKVIEPAQALSRSELTRISNYLTENFAGLTLREIRDRLLRLMAEERAQVDRLLADAISVASVAFSAGEGPQVLFEGTHVVLHQPELADIERVRRLLDTFTHKAKLVQILNQCIEGPGVRVVIGEDSDLTSELGFSLVAAPYGIGDRVLGSLGIFGPTRMEYHRVIPLVNFLGGALSQALESGVWGESGERTRE